jgi:hypothetical protein
MQLPILQASAFSVHLRSKSPSKSGISSKSTKYLVTAGAG